MNESVTLEQVRNTLALEQVRNAFEYHVARVLGAKHSRCALTTAQHCTTKQYVLFASVWMQVRPSPSLVDCPACHAESGTPCVAIAKRVNLDGVAKRRKLDSRDLQDGVSYDDLGYYHASRDDLFDAFTTHEKKRSTLEERKREMARKGLHLNPEIDGVIPDGAKSFRIEPVLRVLAGVVLNADGSLTEDPSKAWSSLIDEDPFQLLEVIYDLFETEAAEPARPAMGVDMRRDRTSRHW